ncbi:MAG: SCO family protein [Deltaproteobacteria bacterium]|nr:SCO family protein [Deltaproteobacteria bacterium]
MRRFASRIVAWIVRGGSVSVLLLVVLIAPVSAQLAAYNAAAPYKDPASYNPFPDVGLDQRLDSQLPLDLTFSDESGKKVQLGDYFGKKPVILSLAYYDCPMLCTLVINGLIRTLRTLSFSAGNEFTVLTVSFNPTDTPRLAAMKKQTSLQSYSRAGAEAGWHFLTGDEATIQRLTQAVGFRYRYDTERKEYAHASGIMVLTPDGRISRYFYGVEYAPRDVRFGLIEAAGGKIGSPVDQLLLLCYHYDPVTGKYGVLITRSLRLAGAATVLGIGGFIILSLRRDRRQKVVGNTP